MNKDAVRQIALRYADAVRKSFTPKYIILFGSHVNGVPDKDSDIDIAVVFEDFKGNWLEASAELFELTYHISVDIEPHMMDTTCDRSGFLEYVMKTGEVIYETV